MSSLKPAARGGCSGDGGDREEWERREKIDGPQFNERAANNATVLDQSDVLDPPTDRGSFRLRW